MIANFFQSLDARKVAYLLISGQATVLYGAATFSEDIDLWIYPEAGNRDRFIAASHDARVRPLAAKHPDVVFGFRTQLPENHLKLLAGGMNREEALTRLAALDSISPDAKKWIAPLPMKYDSTLKCYKEIYENAGGHGGQNLPKSQAIKDATMAYFIYKNWSKGQLFIHYNGAYHSNHHQAIEWYLKQLDPSLKIMVISSTEQKNTETLEEESKGNGDFIICTPASMTKTYK